MAGFHSFLTVLSVVSSILFNVPVRGAIEVVQPYPGHMVAIEGEKVKVTCVLVDFANTSTHANVTKIEFYKIIGSFGNKILIPNQGPQGNYAYEHTEDYQNGVPRWTGTMIINNMTQDKEGHYQCEANNTLARYVMGISYIQKKDLPVINYSRDKDVNFNDPVTLSCTLLKSGNKLSVKLVSIAWFKGQKLLQEIKHPEDESLKNLTLSMDSPTDAGTYKCILTTTLRRQREYKINGNINVKVRPMFKTKELDDNEIITKKGDPGTMNCEARGNPIAIVWKRKLRSESEMTILNQTGYSNQSMQTHYKFSRENQYEGFKLEIPKTDYGDRGDYYCCIRSSNASVPDQCQRFTLRVKDPLRHLWPILGIIVEAILLYFIITSSEKAKKSNQQLLRSRHDTTEASPTTSTDGKEESIRLRKMGTPTIDP